MEKARTLGELEKQGYRVLSVKEEMRKNLITKLGRKETLFPGIVGYDQTVIPQIVNAILAGQDIIFLGERGQAKTRIIRSLVNWTKKCRSSRALRSMTIPSIPSVCMAARWLKNKGLKRRLPGCPALNAMERSSPPPM